MASGTRGTNTFTEGLRAILGDVTQLKAAPDADLAWLVEFETMLVAKIREPLDQQMAKQQQIIQQLGGGGAGSGTVLPGAGGGGGGPGMAPPFPPPNNVRQNPQIPTDAISRFLGQRAPV